MEEASSEEPPTRVPPAARPTEEPLGARLRTHSTAEQHRGPGHDSQRIPLYLLTLAAILGAVISLRADVNSSRASGDWAEARRVEQLRAGYLVRSSDYVFGDIGQTTFQRTEATFLEESLRERAARSTGPTRAALLSEADVQHAILRRAVRSLTFMAKGDAYLQTPGQYYYGEHLASELTLTAGANPASHQSEGDLEAGKARRMIFLTLPAAVAFLLGALAFSSRRFTRQLQWLGVACLSATALSWIVFETGAI